MRVDLSTLLLFYPCANINIFNLYFVSLDRFDPPIEFRPGDELKTKCVFKTTGKDEITYFGEATSVSIKRQGNPV